MKLNVPTETLLGKSFFIAATFVFYSFSTDTYQLLATIKLLLCCAVNMFANLTKKDQVAPEEDKVERIQRRTAEIKERYAFGKGKTNYVRPIKYEKNLSVSEENGQTQVV